MKNRDEIKAALEGSAGVLRICATMATLILLAAACGDDSTEPGNSETGGADAASARGGGDSGAGHTNTGGSTGVGGLATGTGGQSDSGQTDAGQVDAASDTSVVGTGGTTNNEASVDGSNQDAAETGTGGAQGTGGSGTGGSGTGGSGTGGSGTGGSGTGGAQGTGGSGTGGAQGTGGSGTGGSDGGVDSGSDSSVDSGSDSALLSDSSAGDSSDGGGTPFAVNGYHTQLANDGGPLYGGYLNTNGDNNSTINPLCNSQPCFTNSFCVSGTVKQGSAWGVILFWGLNEPLLGADAGADAGHPAEANASLDGKTNVNLRISGYAGPNATVQLQTAAGWPNQWKASVITQPDSGSLLTFPLTSFSKLYSNAPFAPATDQAAELQIQLSPAASADYSYNFCVTELSIQ